jgi:mRNA interferase RelE/StbE
VKTAFRDSFAKDLKAVKDGSLLKRVKKVIESAERADSLTDVPSIKKLKGHKNFFRIRISDYRIGILLQGDTVVFVRALNRKDMYKYFP